MSEQLLYKKYKYKRQETPTILLTYEDITTTKEHPATQEDIASCCNKTLQQGVPTMTMSVIRDTPTFTASQQFLEPLQKLYRENCQNIKINIQEVGYHLYCRGFIDGYDSTFMENFLQSKKLVTTPVTTNHLVTKKGFFQALCRNFNLELNIQLYVHPQDSTSCSWLLQPTCQSIMHQTTYSDTLHQETSYNTPWLQRLQQHNTQPHCYYQPEDIPQNQQLLLTILLGMEYSVFIIYPILPEWSTHPLLLPLLLQPTELIPWQNLLRQTHKSVQQFQQHLVQIFLFSQQTLDKLLEELLTLDNLFCTAIRLIHIQRQGQIIFPYDNAYYEEYLAKPSGEFCLTFGKLEQQTFTPAETVLLHQEISKLSVTLEKIVFL